MRLYCLCTRSVFVRILCCCLYADDLTKVVHSIQLMMAGTSSAQPCICSEPRFCFFFPSSIFFFSPKDFPLKQEVDLSSSREPPFLFWRTIIIIIITHVNQIDHKLAPPCIQTSSTNAPCRALSDTIESNKRGMRGRGSRQFTPSCFWRPSIYA
jgi:hypothetical protein